MEIPHLDLPTPSPEEQAKVNSTNWFKLLNRYHWFVLIVAALGWLFDTMDQQLFNLARVPALKALSGAGDQAAIALFVDQYSGVVTAVFMIGWATGGLIFGKMGDTYGRAKVMAWTILVYSVFTGLSAFSVSIWDFMAYRFLTGLGVGGEFAVGVALVAEVMPARARPHALGLLQSLSAVGNILAGLLGILFGSLEESGAIGDAWRWMFVVGALPALLVLVIRRSLKEPESWQKMHAAEESTNTAAASKAKAAGSYAALFQDARWRHNAIVGLLIAFSGVVGVWGIAFFVFDLLGRVLQEQEMSSGNIAKWKGIALMMFHFGGFFGMYFFAGVSQNIGRRGAFAVCFTLAASVTLFVFAQLNQLNDLFWMMPIMGFCVMSPFGGYAVYLPELFPTHLRSTGTSFCYNVGRFIAATGPLTLGILTSVVFVEYNPVDRFRYAGMAMCSVYLIGMLALPFAPETKGKPLPE